MVFFCLEFSACTNFIVCVLSIVCRILDIVYSIVVPIVNNSCFIPLQPEPAIDMKQRFVGHCNVGTDIKQASFLGQRGIFFFGICTLYPRIIPFKFSANFPKYIEDVSHHELVKLVANLGLHS